LNFFFFFGKEAFDLTWKQTVWNLQKPGHVPVRPNKFHQGHEEAVAPDPCQDYSEDKEKTEFSKELK